MKRVLLFLSILLVCSVRASDPTQQMIKGLSSNLADILYHLPTGVGPDGIPLSPEYLDSLKNLSTAATEVVKRSPHTALLGGAALGGAALWAFSSYGGIHMICDVKRTVSKSFGYKKTKITFTERSVNEVVDEFFCTDRGELEEPIQKADCIALHKPESPEISAKDTNELYSLSIVEERSGSDSTFFREAFANRVLLEAYKDEIHQKEQGTSQD